VDGGAGEVRGFLGTVAETRDIAPFRSSSFKDCIAGIIETRIVHVDVQLSPVNFKFIQFQKLYMYCTGPHHRGGRDRSS
jgi:hypothetical protein